MKAMRSGRGRKARIGHSVAASWRSSPLKATARGEDAAVDLGQGHVHRDVAGAEAALALGPGGLGAAGEDHLQHRDAGGVERGGCCAVAPPGLPTAKLVALRTMSGGASAKSAARVAAERSSLSEATKTGSGFRPSARRPAISASTGSRPPLQEGAVEDQRGGGRAGGPGGAEGGEVAEAVAGVVGAGAEQRRGGRGARAAAEHVRGVAQEARGIVGAAFGEEGPERGQSAAGTVERPARLGSGLSSPGSATKGDAGGAEADGELLERVVPVGGAAHDAGDDEAGAGEGGVEVEVDRVGVREPGEAGEAEAGRARAEAGLGGGEDGDLGVVGGQHDDVGRRLAGVDRGAAVADLAALGLEQVHRRSGGDRGRAERRR